MTLTREQMDAAIGAALSSVGHKVQAMMPKSDRAIYKAGIVAGMRMAADIVSTARSDMAAAANFADAIRAEADRIEQDQS